MRSLGSLLDPKLVARSTRYEKLTLLLRQQLPPECDGHYAVASIANLQLIIVADSPVWATRLRQLAPLILQLVTQQESEIQHIQVKTRMTSPPPAPAPTRKNSPEGRTLSQQASDQLVSAASCISDEPLKNALLKLSRHTRKKA
jgi:hypothetical protein